MVMRIKEKGWDELQGGGDQECDKKGLDLRSLCIGFARKARFQFVDAGVVEEYKGEELREKVKGDLEYRDDPKQVLVK
jgi:hypothetical protein